MTTKRSKKPLKSTIIKARVRRLIARLKAIPLDKYDQDYWCGTACCVAGHAAILAKEEEGYQVGFEKDEEKGSAILLKDGVFEWMTSDDVPNIARKYLGLTTAQANTLFLSSNDDGYAPDGTYSDKVKVSQKAETLKNRIESLKGLIRL